MSEEIYSHTSHRANIDPPTDQRQVPPPTPRPRFHLRGLLPRTHGSRVLGAALVCSLAALLLASCSAHANRSGAARHPARRSAASGRPAPRHAASQTSAGSRSGGALRAKRGGVPNAQVPIAQAQAGRASPAGGGTAGNSAPGSGGGRRGAHVSGVEGRTPRHSALGRAATNPGAAPAGASAPSEAYVDYVVGTVTATPPGAPGASGTSGGGRSSVSPGSSNSGSASAGGARPQSAKSAAVSTGTAASRAARRPTAGKAPKSSPVASTGTRPRKARPVRVADPVKPGELLTTDKDSLANVRVAKRFEVSLGHDTAVAFDKIDPPPPGSAARRPFRLVLSLHRGSLVVKAGSKLVSRQSKKGDPPRKPLLLEVHTPHLFVTSRGGTLLITDTEKAMLAAVGLGNAWLLPSSLVYPHLIGKLGKPVVTLLNGILSKAVPVGRDQQLTITPAKLSSVDRVGAALLAILTSIEGQKQPSKLTMEALTALAHKAAHGVHGAIGKPKPISTALRKELNPASVGKPKMKVVSSSSSSSGSSSGGSRGAKGSSTTTRSSGSSSPSATNTTANGTRSQTGTATSRGTQSAAPATSRGPTSGGSTTSDGSYGSGPTAPTPPTPPTPPSAPG